MKKSDLDAVLSGMLDSHPGISDLLFTVGKPLQVESYGELKEVRMHPNV
jgi:twitching motility protein PilT